MTADSGKRRDRFFTAPGRRMVAFGQSQSDGAWERESRTTTTAEGKHADHE
jgi:hypothetical protein